MTQKLAVQPTKAGSLKRAHDKNPSPSASGGDSNFNFGNYRNHCGRNGGVEKTILPMVTLGEA